MRIAFLTARLPYPPLKGDQARAYHQIRLLSRRHEITVFSFVESSALPHQAEELQRTCRRVVPIEVRRREQLVGLLSGAVGSLPVQSLLHRSPRMRKLLDHELRAGAFDLVHVQLARMAPYLEHDHRLPRVIDLIDSLALNMERRYRRERGINRYAAWLEWRRLERYERQICRQYDWATVVSQLDRDGIGQFPNLSINPNGVDVEKFAYVSPDDARRERGLIAFTGNMGYFPNVDAVCWFATEVFPLVKKQMPDSRFVIIGTNPASAVLRAARADSSITVTGHVEDIPSHLARAQVAVVPMRSGSGMQFKVIEAMAVGTPVVATHFAIGGLSQLRGDELTIETSAGGFAAQVCRLMTDGAAAQSQSKAARTMVERNYSWEACVADLEHVYHHVFATRRQGA